jgi:ribosomal protein S17E
MEEIKKQLVRKYGSKFARDAESNKNMVVNKKLFEKFTVSTPSATLVGKG